MVLALGCAIALPRSLPAEEDLGLRVAPGFRVTMFADENLANDIYAMTLDAKGRVVATSRGYIKTLEDSDGDGKADKATLFATTGTGGMGLCFDGSDLYFCGDGWFSRYRDSDGDGHADGPPERILPLAFAEHGGHSMRKGPDGWWYLIGGNDAQIDGRHASLPSSPIKKPEAGAVLRLPPDCKGSEVIAHGFRNQYDFDINAVGDLFTYDSDVERDAFLPWYSPTRIYHVAYAGHHGWRQPSFLRSWARRDDYLDTVDILWPIGRGSPTGVTCYRHTQFPEHYRGGVFALDWTFGKVYFLPLEPSGASYRTNAEVFIEPTGTHGFAPTDVVVAPDGAVFISIGGRGTRGAIYRVEAIGRQAAKEPAAPLDQVLDAPTPLDAWSRTHWVPAASKLGAGPFLDAIGADARTELARVRAVEVVTELFGGLTADAAKIGAQAKPALVRARTAWSLGRKPCKGFAELLARLADDPDPRPRLSALDALADRREAVDPQVLQTACEQNLAHRDKRVRQAAARLASLLPAQASERLAANTSNGSPQVRITAMLAAVWRHPAVQIHEGPISEVLNALSQTRDTDERLQAVRLIVLALGDWHLNNPRVEAETAYSVQPSLRSGGKPLPISGRIARVVRPMFPTGQPRLDDELARLLAILDDDDPTVPAKVASFWTPNSSPTRDMHFLIVFSRLRGSSSGELTPRVAHALLSLDRKLKGQELRSKQTWNERLAEVTRTLLGKDPSLGDALLRDPEFIAPAHVPVALCLEGEQRAKAARLFLKAAGDGAEAAWSGTLIDLLDVLPPAEARPVLRSLWNDFSLRDGVLVRLAKTPDPVDRDKFLWGVESDQPAIHNAALGALQTLPRDARPEGLVPLLRLLRRSLNEPREASLRKRLTALVARQSGESFAVSESATDPISLRRAYAALFQWFERKYPASLAALNGAAVDLTGWKERLKSVDWAKGDSARGAAVFRARGCQTCHTGQRALGPDLTGVASRFSRDDLFTAILAPSLDVSPLYRTTLIETREGQVYSGLVAFESADGVILQTGATTTARLGTPDIAARKPSSRSLMPDGLLQDLTAGDLADLYRYLQTLVGGR
jgi:putative membrane-bound dehydrogenase-like protein